MRVKLVPVAGDTFEIRVAGPGVSPGYLDRPDLTQAAHDQEGFYCPGDAVSFADPTDPGAGLLFRGRLAEDFKLSTGTFVRVGALRTALLSAAPVLADAVLTGENRNAVGALVWLNPVEAQALVAPDHQGDLPILESAALADHLVAVLDQFNAGHGSAARIERVLVMTQPASLEFGEITDKGYINQRRVLANRADLVELLHTDPPAPGVILARTEEST